MGGNVLRALRQSFLLIVGVYCLSPLYATLARAISGDTIAAASAWLLAVHLYIHDYFFKISVAYKLSGSLSMVAAVAASLLLASRLGSPEKVVRLSSSEHCSLCPVLRFFCGNTSCPVGRAGSAVSIASCTNATSCHETSAVVKNRDGVWCPPDEHFPHSRAVDLLAYTSALGHSHFYSCQDTLACWRL